MTNKFDDCFAERHPERSSQRVIHEVVITTCCAIGCFAGWAYYYFVGCSSGGCMISGTWYISVPYGGLLGYLFLGSFLKKK